MATTKIIKTGLDIDVLTGVEIVRELSVEELENIELLKTEANSQSAEREAKAAARASALAKLAELGLTEEEIAAL